MAFAISAATTGTVRGQNTNKYDITTTAASQLLNGSAPIYVTWGAGDSTITLNGFASAQANPSGKQYFTWNEVDYVFDGGNIQSSSGTTRTVRTAPTYGLEGAPGTGTNGGLETQLVTTEASPSTTADGAYDADGSSGSAGSNFHVDSTAGFPRATTGNPQSAIAGTDVFTYTGFDDNGFTGVSGLADVSANTVVRPVIEVWEKDGIADLVSFLSSQSTFAMTGASTTSEEMTAYTLRADATGQRVILNFLGRLVEDDNGANTLTLTRPTGDTSGRLHLNLAGYNATATGDQAKVTIGRVDNGVQSGTFRLIHDHNPGNGNTQASDLGVNQSNGTLKADNDAANGFDKYYMVMGLPGARGYFRTNHVDGTPAYIIEHIQNNYRFDIDTWEGGMTGNIAMACIGQRGSDCRTHLTATSYNLETFIANAAFPEIKPSSANIRAHEVVGTNAWNMARTYPLSLTKSASDQQLDFQCFNANSLRGNVSLASYDYPNKLIRYLNYGASGSGNNPTHSLVWRPNGAKPPANNMLLNRTQHGAGGGSETSTLYQLSFEPNLQDTDGNVHEKGWMIAYRTYDGPATTAVDTAASSGDNHVQVDSTDGFPTSGTNYARVGTNVFSYTGVNSTGTEFTGVPTSGTYAIPSGGFADNATVVQVEPWQFTNYGNNTNAISRTGNQGRADTNNSCNPDLIHVDSESQGVWREGTVRDQYIWEIDITGDNTKRGGVITFGLTAGQGSGNPAEYFYRGTWRIFVGAPGRRTQEFTVRAITENGFLALTEQAPTIAHNLFPDLSINSSFELNNTGNLTFVRDGSTGTNLLNIDDGSLHDFRTWHTGAFADARTWLATISNIPYHIASTWSAKSRGASSPATGTKYADWNDYVGVDGYVERIVDFDGDFIVSATDTGKFTIKNPANGDLTINCNFTPRQGGGYDTIELSDGASTPNYGNWDLNAGGLECDTASNPHAYLQGNLTDVRTYSTITAAKASGAFTVKGHNRLKGSMTVNVTNTDTYVTFVDCGIQAGDAFQIVRTGTGTGRLFAVAPPSAATITGPSGTTNRIVQEITITRPAIDGETTAANVKGRLSVYNGSTLITDFIGGGSGVSIVEGVVSYTTNDTIAGITIPETGSLRLVWSGPGASDFQSTVSKEAGADEFSITLAALDESVATSKPSGFTVPSITSTNTILTIHVAGGYGANLPSNDETWFFLDNNVRGTAAYNDFIRKGAGSANAGLITNNGQYAQVDGDHIRMTPSSTDNNSQSVGYMQNTSTSTPRNAIGVDRGPVSGVTYYMNINPNAPGISAAAIADGLAVNGVATQTDVNNARNQVIGALS